MTSNALQHRVRKSWLKVIIDVPETMHESVAAFLVELSGTGIESIPFSDNTDSFFTDRIIGYFEIDSFYEDKLSQLQAFLHRLSAANSSTIRPLMHTEHIKEEDWGQEWKKHFKPEKITERIIIKPSWEQYRATDNEIVIELDPGLAFGTGHHASTRLALRLIQDCFTENAIPETVLDVGTGTGILGMASALFGANRVLGIDNDPDAVVVAHENVIRNNLSRIMEISNKNLSTLNESFDVVIANIVHDTLIELARQLSYCLKFSGILILAGILKGEQEENIKEHYSALGLSFDKSLFEDEWVAISFIKAP